MSKKLVVFLLAFVFSMSVFARDNGLYVGGGFGYSLGDQDEDDLQSLITGAGATGTVDVDDTGFGWKFFGGYDFNQYFGFEGGYVNPGQSDATFTLTAPAAATGKVTADLDGFTFNGTLSYPVNDQLAVFGKVGAFFWNADLSGTVSGIGTISMEDDGTDMMFGLGAKYNFSDTISFRGEWERFSDVSDSDVDLFSVSVQYNFDLP